MKILIAMDSFKDALPATAVCKAVARGLSRALPNAHIQPFPMADGGEGTARILTQHNDGQWMTTEVSDPLGRPIIAGYGYVAETRTAFLEMAAASGLQLLAPDERNPLLTSTYGTGELLLHAWRQGARRIVLGLGGSATHDVGMGMASALGYVFLDNEAETVVPGGAQLGRIAHIRADQLKIPLEEITVEVLCDVDNPLYGPKGAAHTYAAQKGAGDEEIKLLETGSLHMAQVIEKNLGKVLHQTPGGGAAGGMGVGTMAFLNAQLRPGTEAVMAYSHIDEALAGTQWVITGEGRIDHQTLHGKLVQGITQRTHQKGIPVIGLCGSLAVTPPQIKQIGLQAAFSIQTDAVSLPQAIARTAANLELVSYNIGCLLANS